MTPVIDENGRLFGLVNVIDLLVVLVLVGLAAGSVGLLVTGDTADPGSAGGTADSGPAGEANVTVEMDVRIEEVPPYVAGAIPGEGPVDGGNVLAISNRSVQPQTVYVEHEGQLLARDHPRLEQVDLTVTVRGQTVAGDVQFQGQPLLVGGTVTLAFPGVEQSATVTGFTVTP